MNQWEREMRRNEIYSPTHTHHFKLLIRFTLTALNNRHQHRDAHILRAKVTITTSQTRVSKVIHLMVNWDDKNCGENMVRAMVAVYLLSCLEGWLSALIPTSIFEFRQLQQQPKDIRVIHRQVKALLKYSIQEHPCSSSINHIRERRAFHDKL